MNAPSQNPQKLNLGPDPIPVSDEELAVLAPELTKPAPVELDILAPENLDAYLAVLEAEASDPNAPGFLERAGEAAGELVSNLGTGASMTGENLMAGVGSAIIGDGQGLKDSIRRQTALTVQAGAMFAGTYPVIGETVKGAFKEVGTKVSVGYQDTPENRRKVAAVRQARDRTLRDISNITEDALMIADYVVGGMDLQSAYAPEQREELMKAAAGLAEVGDLAFAGGAAAGAKLGRTVTAAGARNAAKAAASVGADKVADLIENTTKYAGSLEARFYRAAAAAAGNKVPNFGALTEAGRKIAALQEERIAIDAMADSLEKTNAAAVNATKMAEQKAIIENIQQDLAKRADEAALASNARPGSQWVAGTVVKFAGDVAEVAGKKTQAAVDWLRDRRVSALGESKEAAELGDEMMQRATGVSPGVVERAAGWVADLGENVSTAGKLMRTAESSTPYFQRLAKETDGWTRLAAQQANRVEFISRIGRGVAEATDGAFKGAAVGAVFGTLQGDAAEGAGEGFLGGFFGGGLRTIQLERSASAVRARQIGDIAEARSRRTGMQQRMFDEAPASVQLAAATFEATNPNLVIDFVRQKGSGGSYVVNPDGTGVATIDLDSKIPLVPLMSHEVTHHIARNPDIAADIRRRFFGDAATNSAGIFTEIKDGSVQFKADFAKFRDEYLQALRDAGKDTARYEANPELILHEVIAEAGISSLLAQNVSGEFAGIGALRRNARPLVPIIEQFARSPMVMDSGVLQRVLMATGAVFREDGQYASGTGLFDTEMSPEMRKAVRDVIKQYDLMNLSERAGQVQSFSEIETIYSEQELLSNPELMDLVSSGFDVDVDPETGKRKFLTAREAKRREQEFIDDLLTALDASPDISPGRVRATLTKDGRTIYTGKYIPSDVLETLQAKNKYNPRQLEMLAMVTDTLKNKPGAEAHFVYQPGMTRGSRLYKQRAVTNRVETPISILISRTGGILVNTISQEKVMRNLEFFARKGQLNPWAGDVRAARADLLRYIDNTVSGREGADGIGLEKRDALNALFGQLTQVQRERNPVLQGMSEAQGRKLGVVQSRRLDRINQMKILGSAFRADYGRVSENLRPEENSQLEVSRDIGTNVEFAVPPSDEDARAALSSEKKPKYGAARQLEPGTEVGLRIDIPAFQRTGNYVVAVHQKAKGNTVGKIVGYDNIVSVDNPTFMANEAGAKRIRRGESNKFPIATVEGNFNPDREIPKDINEWTAVGFDPLDHSYFYDKRTDEPVVGGKQAVSIGNTVFVKDPVYGDRADYMYRPEQIDTPEFKRYFRKSKVVDGYGLPKGVFHGAPTEFTVFDPSKAKYSKWGGIGSWFSEDPSYANSFRGGFDSQGNKTIGPLLEIYLSLKEPAVYEGNRGFEQLIRDYESITGVKTNRGTPETNRKFVDKMKELGFDGIVIKNHTADAAITPEPQTFYVAFDPTQIKSATDNIGTFDPQNPDFNYRPEAKDIDEVAQQLGLEKVGDGAKKFGYFMQQMGAKGITPRDVVKAYLITTSSINRGALSTEKVRGGWSDLAHDEDRLRPEDAFAKLLGTREGQRFLDAAERGEFDEAAANTMLEKFKPFGLYNTQREYMRNAAENLSKVGEAIVDAVENMPTEEYAEFVRENFKGISFGKVGFMSGMLGRGDLPTVDVRQRKLHYGDQKFNVDKQILLEVRDRLANLGVFLTEDLKPFYQTIVHHAVWDRLEGTDTSHADIKEAMLQFRPDTTQPKSEVEKYTKAEKIEAPSVSLKDLVGKRIFPIEGDLTMVGTYRGIDSAVVVPVPAFGGPGFAAAPQNVKTGVVWANDTKGKQTQFKNLAADSDYAVIIAQDQKAHTSNTTTVTAFLNTLDAYIRDGRIGKRDLERADVEIRKAAAEMGVTVPSITDPSFIPTIRDATFPVRKRIVTKMESSTFEEFNFPPAKRIIDELRQPEYHGVGTGDALLLVKVDPDAEPIKLGENGTAMHPDYDWGIAGKLIGKFDSPVPFRLLFKDFIAERRRNPDDKGPSHDFRSITSTKPIVTVTDEMAGQAANLAKVGAVSKRQMQAALAAATGSWMTSDDAKNEGGVSIADFARALRSNKSAPSLTPYTEEMVKAKVKSGEMTVYKLQNAEIYFALVNDGDKRVISSVVNNEPGARGVAAPAVLSKAIEQGATHLDCFAVLSAKHPTGFLPELYNFFGFEDDVDSPIGARVNFDRKFFDADWKAVGQNPDIKFADLLRLWQSEGWNPATPEPQVTFMRLRQEFTDDDSRRQYNRRLLEQNPGRMADRERITRGGESPDAQPNRAGAGAGGAGGNNAGANRGVAGNRRGVSDSIQRSIDSYRAIVRELGELSDQDATARGLDIGQIRRLREVLSPTKSTSKRRVMLLRDENGAVIGYERQD